MKHLYLKVIILSLLITPQINAQISFTSTPVENVNPGDTYSYLPQATNTSGDVIITATTLPGAPNDWLTLKPERGDISRLIGFGAVSSYYDITVLSNGDSYVADTDAHEILKIDTNGNVTIFAGSGTAGFADGIGTTAQFSSPSGITSDDANNLYVSDTGNNRIRKIDPSGNVTTICGKAQAGNNDGNFNNASFDAPVGITKNDAGTILFIADSGNGSIRQIFLGDNLVFTLDATIGTGIRDIHHSTNPVETLYISDVTTHSIKKFVIGSGGFSTLAGGFQGAGYTDGNAILAQFDTPIGLTTDFAGNIYVADSGNNRIRKIAPNSGYVTTLAGDGSAGFADGEGDAATFDAPCGIDLNSGTNNFHIVEAGNDDVRILEVLDLELTGDTTGVPLGDYDVVLEVSDPVNVQTEVQQSFTITIGTLGIEDSTIEGLKAYPNPTKGSFTISASVAIETIEVYNMLGQSVMSKSSDSNFKTTLNLDNLSKGTYFVKVSAENTNTVIKLIKD